MPTTCSNGCCQWGNQKRYCGEGAKQKADAQGRAAYANGYKGGGSKSKSSGGRGRKSNDGRGGYND